MSNQKTDRTKLTFSQAEGIDPLLPQPAALGELPHEARNALWNITYNESMEPDWIGIQYDYHTSFLHQPADEFPHVVYIPKIKDLFLRGDYNRVFDFLQFVLRHGATTTEFFPSVAFVLEEYGCAYTVVEEDDPTIVPIALPEQKESLQEAFQVLRSGPFEGARSHLRKSAEYINNGDWADSVRESIHAVESVACRLDEDSETSLTPALDALSQKIVLHGAFKKGIENLYGYTSDEKGIRHALLEEKANVDTADASFMFGACTSFAVYLVNKARKAGLLEQ